MRRYELLLCCLLLASSCASSADLETDARRRVDDSLRERGVAIPDTNKDQDARIRELLQDGLSEDDALVLALGVNRHVRARLAELGVGAAQLASAALWSNPTLHAEFLLLDDGTEIDLGLSQSLYDALLLPLRKAKSGAELRLLETQTVKAVVEIAFESRRLHALAIAAQRELELSDAELAAARGAQDLMRDLAVAGNVPPVATARLDVDVARRAQQRAGAERAWLQARERLNHALGLWGQHTQWQLQSENLRPSSAIKAWEALEARAVAASLDLAAARAQLEAQAQAAGIADWSAWLPGAQLGLVAMREADSSHWDMGPSAAIGLPLYDAGSSAQHKAQAQLRMLADEYWALAVEVRSETRLRRDRIRSLELAEAHAREQWLPAERTLVEETLRNFNAMQIGAFEVLRVRMKQIEAERAVARLQAELQVARLDLDALLAGSLSSASAAVSFGVGLAESPASHHGAH